MSIKTFRKKKSIHTRKNNSVNKIQLFEQEIIIKFICLLNTIKLYHWKTYSYATHKATDELYSKLNSNIDTFIEVLLGKLSNRVNLTRVKTVPLKDLSSSNEMKREIEYYKKYLLALNNNKVMNIMSNPDLFTIRDEILADLNQFLYLLSFT